MGTNFNTGANWTGGVAPGSGDVAWFKFAEVTQPNLSASLSIAGLYFNGTGSSGYDVTSNAGVVLTLTGYDPAGSGGTSNSSAAAIRSEIGSGTNTIDVNLNLAPPVGHPTSTIWQSGGGTLVLNGSIGSASSITLTLASTGTFQINGANTYSGTTVQSVGSTIVIGNKAAFGTSTLSFASNANQIQAGTDLTGANKLANNIIWGANATIINSGSNGIEFGGTVDLGGAARTINSAISGGATFDNVISNDGGNGLTISATNSSVVTLKGLNTYSGDTIISGTGKVVVSTIGNQGDAGNLGTGANINLGAGTASGTLSYTGTGETTDRLINLTGTTGGAVIDQSGTGALVFRSTISSNSVAGAKTLTLQGSTTGTGEIDANFYDSDKPLSVVKAGTGTWILGGTSQYTGTTTINGGTLLINGDQTNATGAVTVNNSGSVLGGTGTVGGAVSLGSNAILRGGAGSLPSGSLTLNSTVNTASGIVQLALGSSGAHSSLASNGSGWIFGTGQKFNFIDLGATAGTTYDNIISGLSGAPNTSPSGWTVTDPGWSGSFVYDGSGNIDFTLTAVPEPSTWVAAALAFGAVGWSQRRRLRELVFSA